MNMAGKFSLVQILQKSHLTLSFPIEQTVCLTVLTKFCLYYVSMVSIPKKQIYSLSLFTVDSYRSLVSR